MSKFVFKYPLTPRSHVVELPKGAEILSVANQAETIVLYALVDPEQPVEPRAIEIILTGEEIVTPQYLGRFIGTVMLGGGSFVVHVFEPRQ